MKLNSDQIPVLPTVQIISSWTGEEMGFLFHIDMEHNCVAHADQLLHQDCDLNCTNVSQGTAGKRARFLD